MSPAENEPVRFYHTDALGSVLTLSGKNGNVLATYSYEPYGGIRHQEGSSDNANTFVGGYGVRNDSGAGYYMVNRYYDYTKGVFKSMDPLYFSQIALFQDGYLYSVNNPVFWIDPFGLSNVCPSDNSWIGKLGQGYYYGTYQGEKAAEWYADQVASGNWEYAPFGLLASLWTPDTFISTATSLAGGMSVNLAFAKLGIEETVMNSGNVYKIVSKEYQFGFRVDKGVHGPWGHMHFWTW